MVTLRETQRQIIADPEHWSIYLMDFVDDFRYYKNPAAIAEPLERHDPKMDALLVSTVEYLCDEAGMRSPDWAESVPASRDPWFVSGMESLRAIALVESPLRFRIRKVFVLGNFLERV